MKTCEGCDFLEIEPCPHGACNTRCMAPFPKPWGNGRVLTHYRLGVPQLHREERPKYCTKE